VIQQGMNGDRRQARRYHWLSEGLENFVDAPHSAIDGTNQGEIVNLTDRMAAPSRSAQLDLIADLGPDKVVHEYALLSGEEGHEEDEAQPALPYLFMPAHHDVRAGNVFLRRLHGTLAAAAERAPVDFPELLLTPGVGARTVEALAMVAEVLHGTPCRFADPARFSLAHGGKDRHPFPVPLKVYDETIRVLRSAVDKAKLGQDDRLTAIRALDMQARSLEAIASGPGFEAYVAGERHTSAGFGGMSVFGAERDGEMERR
jgi:hypothetical protein